MDLFESESSALELWMSGVQQTLDTVNRSLLTDELSSTAVTLDVCCLVTRLFVNIQEVT